MKLELISLCLKVVAFFERNPTPPPRHPDKPKLEDHLDEDGLPYVGKLLKKGDPLYS